MQQRMISVEVANNINNPRGYIVSATIEVPNPVSIDLSSQM